MATYNFLKNAGGFLKGLFNVPARSPLPPRRTFTEQGIGNIQLPSEFSIPQFISPKTPASIPSPTPAIPSLNFTPVHGIEPTPVMPQIKASPITSLPAPVAPKLPAGAPTVPPPVAPPLPVSAPVQPQVPQTGVTPQPAPFTPTPAQQAAISSAEATYQKSLQISPEELSTQEDLDKLSESARRSYTNIRNQAIPLEFITGQLASVERRALDLAEPLERKLARLQAARTSSADVSKFALERADKAVETARGEAKDIRAEAKDIRIESESARRFGIEQAGAVETRALAKTKMEQDKVAADRKFEEDRRQFGLDYAIKQREVAVKELEAKAKTQTAVSPYQEERSIRTVQSVDELLTKAQESPGIFGRTAVAPIPSWLRTDAYRNFESELTTLKSSIFSGELTAMREASKTGGAVGSVSDREGDKLENALGALNMSQSAENIQSQLLKIKESINRWREAVGSKAIGEAPPMFQLPDGTVVRLQPDGTYK